MMSGNTSSPELHSSTAPSAPPPLAQEEKHSRSEDKNVHVFRDADLEDMEPMPYRKPNANTLEELKMFVNKRIDVVGMGYSEAATYICERLGILGLFLAALISYCFMAEELSSSGCLGCISLGCFILCGVYWVLLQRSQQVVPEGHIGIAVYHQKPMILQPGYNYLVSRHWGTSSIYKLGGANIHFNVVSIITIQQGDIGFATDNGYTEILLPGRHVRVSGTFKFLKSNALNQPIITSGPISIISVAPGSVGVGILDGKLIRLSTGKRHEIYSSTFRFLSFIPTTDQVLQFSPEHIVTQDGVQMNAGGLLTFQVIDVVQLLSRVGTSMDVVKLKLEQVTEAVLVEQFTKINLKRILNSPSGEGHADSKEQDGLFGGPAPSNSISSLGSTNPARNNICEGVTIQLREMTKDWGVSIQRFQMKSLLFKDQSFASKYESATLRLATTEVERRSCAVENTVALEKAKSESQLMSLVASAKKDAFIKAAQGEAEAIELVAKARNTAAEMMTDPLAHKLALLEARKDIVSASQLKSLTVLNEKALVSPFFSQGEEFGD